MIIRSRPRADTGDSRVLGGLSSVHVDRGEGSRWRCEAGRGMRRWGRRASGIGRCWRRCGGGACRRRWWSRVWSRWGGGPPSRSGPRWRRSSPAGAKARRRAGARRPRERFRAVAGPVATPRHPAKPSRRRSASCRLQSLVLGLGGGTGAHGGGDQVVVLGIFGVVPELGEDRVGQGIRYLAFFPLRLRLVRCHHPTELVHVGRVTQSQGVENLARPVFLRTGPGARRARRPGLRARRAAPG